LYHEINRSKDAALRSGLAAATKPYIFVQEADLEYDPADFAAMLPPCSTVVLIWCTDRAFWVDLIVCFSSGTTLETASSRCSAISLPISID
jgi:hypothetical protein